jgi:hypothetical protein
MDYVEVSVEKFGDYLNAFSMILFGRWSKVKLTPNLVTFNTDNLPLALTRAQSVCQMRAFSIRCQYLTVKVALERWNPRSFPLSANYPPQDSPILQNSCASIFESLLA